MLHPFLSELQKYHKVANRTIDAPDKKQDKALKFDDADGVDEVNDGNQKRGHAGDKQLHTHKFGWERGLHRRDNHIDDDEDQTNKGDER